MKIYTKTGDGGTTALIGGRRVEKNHPRVEAYGAVDELSAHIGYLRDNLPSDRFGAVRGDLLHILNDLMTLSAILACEGATLKKLPSLTGEHLDFLEQRIDRMQESLPPVERFTLPGGHPMVSLTHIARTVCRRAERRATAIASDGDSHESQHETAKRYLNRLSDYLYVLSRQLSRDFGAEELFWSPNE
jgi:cob(I)alamin adenosyltransferase